MAVDTNPAFGDLGYPMKRIPSQTKDGGAMAEASSDMHSFARDEFEMARFGKRSQLNRHFGFLSILGLTCTLMITWEAILLLFQSGLENGGPAGLVYGFIFVWLGVTSQTLVMAEIGSMIPLAGGQYNWVAVLAPPSCSKFLSYLTGWMAFIAWQAILASAAYIGGTAIQGLLILNYPDYVPERWHGTLLLYAIVAGCLFINTFLARVLPQIESVVMIVHVLGFFCVLIPLIFLAPHSDAASVFESFTDDGGWATDGTSLFVSLPTSMFAFLGTDAAAHMAEEIENASTVIPWSMITSVILNGVLALGMVIAVLFCIGPDVQGVLNSPTGYPFIQILTGATGSNTGGSVVSALIITMMIFAAVGITATASRMAWAFARENGLPFSNYISRVNQRTSLPLYAIALSVAISFSLGLINFGSSAAFNALVSLTVAGFYSCYLVAAVVFLYKQLTCPAHEIIWGPFRLYRWSIPINVFSIAYSIIGFFFSFWPAVPDPTAEGMNWASAVFGFAVLFSMGYWAIWGRKIYTGPVVEVQLRDFMDRDGWRARMELGS